MIYIKEAAKILNCSYSTASHKIFYLKEQLHKEKSIDKKAMPTGKISRKYFYEKFAL